MVREILADSGARRNLPHHVPYSRHVQKYFDEQHLWECNVPYCGIFRILYLNNPARIRISVMKNSELGGKVECENTCLHCTLLRP